MYTARLLLVLFVLTLPASLWAEPDANTWSRKIDGFPIHIYTKPGETNPARRSVLVLGTFSDADEAIAEARRLINPSTGETYDVIIGLSDISAPGASKPNDVWKRYGKEVGGRVLGDHFNADKNAAALKKGIESRFGSPLDVAIVDTHSNGTPVGITAIEQGAFRGVKELHLMGPDIGFAGQYVEESRLNRLKDRGMQEIHIHRTRGDIIHGLGHMTQGIAQASKPFSDTIAQGARNAVAQTMGLSAAGGKVDSIITSHEYEQASFTRDPFDAHYAKRYIAQRAEHSNDAQLIAKTQKLMGAPEYNHAIGRPIDLTMPTSYVFQGKPLSEILRDGTAQENVQLIAELTSRLDSADTTPRRNNLRAMLDYAQAYVTAKQQDGVASAKGVRIRFDERILAEVLKNGTAQQNATLLEGLGKKLAAAATVAQRNEVMAGFENQVNERFRQSRSVRRLDDLKAVSLKSLVTAAETHVKHWNDLPSELRLAGGLTRIHGYVISGDDILILGRTLAGAKPIELDDLIVGIRAAWKENATPLVSLDPDPQNMEGDPQVRIQGVPADSAFALTMLEADYAMKKIMGGLEPVAARGYQPLTDFLRDTTETFISRFWLYPIQPGMGDIQITPDGSSAIFLGGVQVLSEEMMLLKDGLIGTGKNFGPAEKAARSFTVYYSDIAAEKADFRRLEGLFDVVLLARIWRNTGLKAPLIERLCALPHRTVSIPKTYPAIRVVLRRDRDMEYFLVGGAQAKVGAGRFSWLALSDDNLAAVSVKCRDISATGQVATALGKMELSATAPSTRSDESSLHFSAAVKHLLQGDLAAALGAANELVASDPFDGDSLMLRALVHTRRADYKHAKRDAVRARELHPDSPEIAAATSEVLFQCSWMEGNPQAALKELEWTLRNDPNSARANVARGEAMMLLDQLDEARLAFEKALKADPSSAISCARMAQLELVQGKPLAAKPWVLKAQALAPNLPEVRVAGAQWELTIIRPDKAEKLATQVWDDKAASPTARLQALTVLAAVSASREKWDDVDKYVGLMAQLSAGSPEVLIAAAEIAFTWGERTIGMTYLAKAEQLAPAHPLVVKLRKAKGRP